MFVRRFVRILTFGTDIAQSAYTRIDEPKWARAEGSPGQRRKIGA